MSKKKDLVQIIRDNPGCVAIVDNDCWMLYRKHPDENPHIDCDDEEDAAEEWAETNLLCDDDGPFKKIGDGQGGYGSGNCYDDDILQALAVIVGIKVTSI